MPGTARKKSTGVLKGPYPCEKQLPSSGMCVETMAGKAAERKIPRRIVHSLPQFPHPCPRDAILVAQNCNWTGEDTDGGHHVTCLCP